VLWYQFVKLSLLGLGQLVIKLNVQFSCPFWVKDVEIGNADSNAQENYEYWGQTYPLHRHHVNDLESGNVNYQFTKKTLENGVHRKLGLHDRFHTVRPCLNVAFKVLGEIGHLHLLQ